MGHYDEQREEHDHAELKKRAEAANRSVEDQLEYENVFLPAKKRAAEHEEGRKAVETYNRLTWKFGM